MSKTPIENPEKADEIRFEKKHRFYSSVSSWLFALSSATNIAILTVFSGKVISAFEKNKPLFYSSDKQEKPLFSNKRLNCLALGMMAFGGVCMYLSNWLETKKVVLEWQLGGNKLARKMNNSLPNKNPYPKMADESTNLFSPRSSGKTEFHSASPEKRNWVMSLTDTEQAVRTR